MEIKCKYCKWARKAENKNYIGCVAAVRRDINDYFSFYGKQEISTGWVNLRCYPDGHDYMGMITNGIPCFNPEDCCDHFELRELD